MGDEALLLGHSPENVSRVDRVRLHGTRDVALLVGKTGAGWLARET